MKYRNAEKLLPRRLLRELQQYAGGELIYVPAGSEKSAWGGRNGAKTRYRERNDEIRARHRGGEPIPALAALYCLSEDSIRKIVRRREETEA